MTASELGVGSHVVGTLDTGGELRGEIIALVGRLATVRTAGGRTYTRSLNEIAEQHADGLAEPYCACGRRWSQCDGSRLGCRK